MKIEQESFITFVVPAYNAQDTLRRTIDSILHQTSEHYKIIIVNDGSKDDTERICKEYQTLFPEKVTAITQENRGLGGARNHGMELVDTEYVSFLDSDDWLMPEYVETLEKELALYRKRQDEMQIGEKLTGDFAEDKKVMQSIGNHAEDKKVMQSIGNHAEDKKAMQSIGNLAEDKKVMQSIGNLAEDKKVTNPKQLAKQNQTCSNNPVEMIMTLPRIYHEGSRAVRNWYDYDRFMKLFPTDGVICNPAKEPLIYQFEVNLCRKVLQMDFLRRIHFSFQEKIKWEDVVPHFYLLSKCNTCMGIGSVGFYYRIGGKGQITAQRGSDRLDFLQIMQELVTYIESEKLEELRFPAMRVLVRFSIWCIRMADSETRKKLVMLLHEQFKKLPRAYSKELKNGTKKNYSKKDAFQYRLFMLSMRYRIFTFIYYDYFYQDMGEKLVKKLLKAGPRVA